jgi:hypothetical protein
VAVKGLIDCIGDRSHSGVGKNALRDCVQAIDGQWIRRTAPDLLASVRGVWRRQAPTVQAVPRSRYGAEAIAVAIYKLEDDGVDHQYENERGLAWGQFAWVTASIVGVLLPIAVFVGMLFDWW